MAILIGMTGNVFLITVNNFIEAKETRSALSFSWVISINHASLSCELNVSYSNYYIATSLAPVSILKRRTIEWFNVKCRLDKFKILKVFEIQDIWFCYFVNGIVWRKKGVLCNPIRMRQNVNIDVFLTGNMERNFQLFRKKQFDENIICWSFNFSQFSTI